MLKHQIEFSKAMTELYKPISGRASDPNSTVPEGNPEGIQACEEYEAIVQDLLEKLSPELEQIETHIINPAEQLLEIIKVIRKVAVKREHKKLDYDRHRNALKKLQDKKDKSLKDEKAMYKVENELEVSTQEYNHYNDLMKEELPRLFQLEAEFIKPLFQSFYYMQLNVFYTLHEAMQGMNIPYFDMSTEVVEGFEAKRGDVKDRAEQLGIIHFKSQAGRSSKPGLHGRNSSTAGRASTTARSVSSASTGDHSAAGYHVPPAASPYGVAQSPTYAQQPQPYGQQPYGQQPYGQQPAYAPQTAYAQPAAYGQPAAPQQQQPPSYQAATYASPTAAAYSPSPYGASGVGKAKPPPPKPKPKFGAPVAPIETVTALYDYAAQAPSDISFNAGDVIEIVQRTDNVNEWWLGKINGQTGQFPGM